MNRRLVITVVGLLLLALLSWWGLRGWQTRDRQGELTQLAGQMNKGGLAHVADTARRILELDPGRASVRVEGAEALLQLGRARAARQMLRPLVDGSAGPEARVSALMADSYLQDALAAALEADRANMGMKRPAVRDGLTQAAAFRSELSADPAWRVPVAVLLARDAEVRMVMARRGLPLARRGADPDAGTLPTDAVALAREDLVAACQAAIDAAPQGAVEARAIRFRLALDDGSFAEARRLAGRMAELAETDARLAGPVADALLNLDMRHAQPVTTADIELARRLLQRGDAGSGPTLAVELAQLRLMLRDGRHADAAGFAGELLSRYPGHTRAAGLRVEALIGAGDAEGALKLVRRWRARDEETADLLHAHALTLRALGDGPHALELLERVLERQPNHIPARLAHVELLMAQERVAEAGLAIQEAIALSPNHPRVRQVLAAWCAASGDRDLLAALIEGDGGLPPASAPGPPDLALGVAMVLDDTAQVARLRAARLAADAGDALGLVAGTWLASDRDPLVRVSMAATVLHALDRMLAPDPLKSPRAPAPLAVMQSMPGLGGADSLDGQFPTRALLREAPFCPWNAERARTLLRRALAIWPGDAALVEDIRRLDLWLDWGPAAPQPATGLALRGGSEGEPEPTAALQKVLVLLGRDPPDPAAVDAALLELLEPHPWSRLAVLPVLARWLDMGDESAVNATLAAVASVNGDLASLVRAHLAYARGRPRLAVEEIARLLRGAEPGSELRWLAADLQARAYAASGRIELGLDAMESLTLVSRQRRHAMMLSVAEMLSYAGRRDDAMAPLVAMMSETWIKPRMLECVLVRVEAEVSPPQLLRLMRYMEPAEAVRPYVELYRARLLTRLGRLADADALLTALEQRWPDRPGRCRDAPAVVFARVHLQLAAGERVAARAELLQLAAQGGVVAAEARRLLDELDEPAGVGTSGSGVTAGGR